MFAGESGVLKPTYYHLNVSYCADGEPPKTIPYASASKSQENTASHCERLGVVYSLQYKTVNIEEVCLTGIRFPIHQTQSYHLGVVLCYLILESLQLTLKPPSS